MTTRQLTVETYWTPETRRHHSPKSLLRLKGHWLHEAGFTPNTPVNVSVETRTLTITPKGDTTMTNPRPTLDDLRAQVRAAVETQLHAHPEGIDPNELACTIAEQIAPTDPQALLSLAANDDPTLGERHGWLTPRGDATEIIRSNLIDTLWETAAHTILH
jgi:hypothetical protein